LKEENAWLLFSFYTIFEIMPSYLDNLTQFDSVTVSRGKTYFAEGRVSLTHVDLRRAEAYVEGSERYRVTISFDGNKKMTSSRCDCPCQFPCKHVVAVLCALDDQDKAALPKTFSIDSFSEAVAHSKKRGGDFDFFTLGQSLLLSIGALKDEDKKAALRLYFGSYVLLGDLVRYDYRGLTTRLLKASGLSSGDLQAFFTSFLEDESLSLFSKKNLLRFLFDAGGPGQIFDEAFLTYCQYHEAVADEIFRDSLFLGNQLALVPDDFLLYLLEHDFGSFSAYDLKNRFPLLNKDSSLTTVALYLALIETLKRQASLSYAPREGISLLEKLGHLSEAKETAKLYFLSSLELSDYIAYRHFFKDPVSEKESEDLSLLARRSTHRDAIFLYESGSIPSFPKADLSKISLEDFGLLANHFNPSFKDEVVGSIVGKIDDALAHPKKQKDIYGGLVALSRVDPEKAKTYLKDPVLDQASLLEESFRAGYLSLLSRFSLLDKLGYHPYPSEAKHVS
jgi:hypothetical protein